MRVPKETLQRLTERNKAMDYAIDPRCRWCGRHENTLGAKRRHELECEKRES